MLAPSLPFGDGVPPSENRLAGLLWLPVLFGQLRPRRCPAGSPRLYTLRSTCGAEAAQVEAHAERRLAGAGAGDEPVRGMKPMPVARRSAAEAAFAAKAPAGSSGIRVYRRTSPMTCHRQGEGYLRAGWCGGCAKDPHRASLTPAGMAAAAPWQGQVRPRHPVSARMAGPGTRSRPIPPRATGGSFRCAWRPP